jgi:hypothetical protein
MRRSEPAVCVGVPKTHAGEGGFGWSSASIHLGFSTTMI